MKSRETRSKIRRKPTLIHKRLYENRYAPAAERSQFLETIHEHILNSGLWWFLQTSEFHMLWKRYSTQLLIWSEHESYRIASWVRKWCKVEKPINSDIFKQQEIEISREKSFEELVVYSFTIIYDSYMYRRKWQIVIAHHAQQVLERKTIILLENIKTNISWVIILFKASAICC